MPSWRCQPIWIAAAFVLAGQSAAACAVCYGEPDAPMSRGLTWAVIALGGMIGTVLVAVTGFFVHVQRRARRIAAVECSPNLDC